ncbi:MAG: sterol desaturase family protein [Gammaproteobacteria bacterium]
MDFTLDIDESGIRLGFFIGVLLTIACLEVLYPRRKPDRQRMKRWPHNIGISFVSQILVRVTVPITAAGLALKADAAGWGLLNAVTMNPVLELFIAVLLLDLGIYWQHRVFHILGPLWRLHRMHHADIYFDVTTGIRFHPLSILISVFIKLGAIILIGPTALAVLIFEILLNATSLFNHSNLYIPPTLDKYLRLFIVTPDMHRVHHSTDNNEMNCNFGFNFPWWDRLFRSYLAAPHLGHEQMEIGLAEFRADSERSLVQMLTQPFRS